MTRSTLTRSTHTLEHRPLLDVTVPILIRRSGEVQVGCSPDRALLIAPPRVGGAAALADLLRALDGVRTPDQLQPLVAASGLSSASLQGLLEHLADAGLLRWVAPPQRVRLPTVLVHGRGPLSDALADGLTSIGVLMRRSEGTALPDRRASGPVDVVLLTDAVVIDPCLSAALVAAGTAHLQVRLRDGTGVVGPLVLPGRTSCLRCADLHRSDRDPEWPILAAQLMRCPGHGSTAAVRSTAGLALGQVEQWLYGASNGHRPPSTLGATLELDLLRDTLHRRPWPPHHRCGCGAHQ